jgi:hypothetical protein
MCLYGFLLRLKYGRFQNCSPTRGQTDFQIFSHLNSSHEGLISSKSEWILHKLWMCRELNRSGRTIPVRGKHNFPTPPIYYNCLSSTCEAVKSQVVKLQETLSFILFWRFLRLRLPRKYRFQGSNVVVFGLHLFTFTFIFTSHNNQST